MRVRNPAFLRCRATSDQCRASYMAMGRVSGPGRVVLWTVVALAVVGASLGAAPGLAVADEGTEGHFSDDDGSVHEPALDALAARGVLAGMECGEGLICPSEPLKRWEMAVWLVRVLDGSDPAAVDASRFVDVDAEQWWVSFVERLYLLEVTVGCATEPARFCPDRDVTRAEMATFLKRAFDLELAPSAGFTDVSGGSHAANIDALAAAGITMGCAADPLRYCPDRDVTRAQMATFLARALGLIEQPPSVRFTAVDVGSGHACALRTDGSVACWGDNRQVPVRRSRRRVPGGSAPADCTPVDSTPMVPSPAGATTARASPTLPPESSRRSAPQADCTPVDSTPMVPSPAGATTARASPTLPPESSRRSAPGRATRAECDPTPMSSVGATASKIDPIPLGWGLQRRESRQLPHLRLADRLNRHLLGHQLLPSGRRSQRAVRRRESWMGAHLRAARRRHRGVLGIPRLRSDERPQRRVHCYQREHCALLRRAR